MSPTADQVLQAALSLPYEDRSELIIRLKQSVEAFANPEIAVEWEEEIARRIKESDEGSVASIPAEDIYRTLREKHGFFTR